MQANDTFREPEHARCARSTDFSVAIEQVVGTSCVLLGRIVMTVATTGSVQLREIDDENRAAVEALRVAAEQETYVRDVAGSIREAAEYPDAAPWCRALYDGEVPVGFVLISDGITPENMKNPEYLGPYYLWRLLIDHRQQGRGYGSAAIRLVVAHLRTAHPDARVLLTSCVPGPLTPLPFYLRQGFHETGEVHEGETVLELEIRSAGASGLDDALEFT